MATAEEAAGDDFLVDDTVATAGGTRPWRSKLLRTTYVAYCRKAHRQILWDKGGGGGGAQSRRTIRSCSFGDMCSFCEISSARGV